MQQIRYIYSTHKTRDNAENYLDNLFAAGEVSQSELPRVEKIQKTWCVTLCDTALSAYS